MWCGMEEGNFLANCSSSKLILLSFWLKPLSVFHLLKKVWMLEAPYVWEFIAKPSAGSFSIFPSLSRSRIFPDDVRMRFIYAGTSFFVAFSFATIISPKSSQAQRNAAPDWAECFCESCLRVMCTIRVQLYIK